MAFVTGPALPVARVAAASSVCNVRMNAEGETPKLSRRAALQAAAAAVTATVAAPLASFANIEYPNVGYLGGSDKIDVNNANVRAYLKFPGFYPSLAGIIVSNGPYKSTDEIKSLPGVTDKMKETLSKYKDNLVALEPAPEYELDKLNNGLYR